MRREGWAAEDGLCACAKNAGCLAPLTDCLLLRLRRRVSGRRCASHRALASDEVGAAAAEAPDALTDMGACPVHPVGQVQMRTVARPSPKGVPVRSIERGRAGRIGGAEVLNESWGRGDPGVPA